MNEDQFAGLRQRVAEFDEIIYQARSAQHADVPPDIAQHFIEADPVLRWSLPELMASYLVGNIYSIERLPGVMDRLIDTKLQLHFVTQVIPGTMNAMVYLRGFDEKNPLATPSLQLARLGYSQALIGAQRILWERLMRLIYFLETGTDPPGKSTSRRFFGDLPHWSPRWDLLAEWQDEIVAYDKNYRTPEYHQGSVLKRELLGGVEVDMNEVLGLTTPVLNGVWSVMIANVEGRPHNISSLGRKVRPSD
jgi:hypothetical protein